MRGRKPKPTALKLLCGNPGKRKLNRDEPTAAGIPDCPDFLDAIAKEEWNRCVKVLAEMNVLTKADRSALAAYCVAYSRWVEAEALVKKFGTIVKSPEKGYPLKSPYLTVADQALESMRKLMVEFGMTPSSRSRLKMSDLGSAGDEFDLFMEQA
jgi:P27 family predicted phage terminase small subunit